MNVIAAVSFSTEGYAQSNMKPVGPVEHSKSCVLEDWKIRKKRTKKSNKDK